MTTVQPNFDRFVSNISLDATRREQIHSAVRNFNRFVAQDEPLAKLLQGQPFTQGSFSYNTVTRPREEDEGFDVDLVLPLAIDRLPLVQQNPDYVLTYVQKRLKTYYENRVERRSRCVRIRYARQFHLDLVPAWVQPGTEVLGVPDRNEDSWSESNPLGFTRWVNQRNGKSRMRLNRAVKMLKYWRDQKFGADTAPKSILLTTIVGLHAEGLPNDDDRAVSQHDDAGYMHNLMLAMESWASNHIVNVQFLGVTIAQAITLPQVENPSLPGENLARDLDDNSWKVFRSRLSTLRARISDAYHDDDPIASADSWQDAFGDAFPVYP